MGMIIFSAAPRHGIVWIEISSFASRRKRLPPVSLAMEPRVNTNAQLIPARELALHRN